MMCLDILMDFDADSLLEGECNYYLYREQSQGQKIQERDHQAKVEDFKVAGEFFVIQKLKLVSRTKEYTESGHGQGPIFNIQKFLSSKNGEEMSEHGLEFGMTLYEGTDKVQNMTRKLEVPLQTLE